MSSAGSGQPVGAVWTYTGDPGIKIPDYRRRLRTTSLRLRRDSSLAGILLAACKTLATANRGITKATTRHKNDLGIIAMRVIIDLKMSCARREHEPWKFST